MKNKKQFSALRQRAGELENEYIGFDDMLDELSAKVYNEMKRFKI